MNNSVDASANGPLPKHKFHLSIMTFMMFFVNTLMLFESGNKSCETLASKIPNIIWLLVTNLLQIVTILYEFGIEVGGCHQPSKNSDELNSTINEHNTCPTLILYIFDF